jgi:hypothetical protein
MAGKEAQRADGHPEIAGTARHDVGQRLIDLTAVVGIDGALVHLLLLRRDHGANHRVVHLVL